MNKITTILCFIFLTGCQQNSLELTCTNYPDIDLLYQMTDFPIFVHLSEDFTENDLIETKKAIFEWNLVIGEEVFILDEKDSNKNECGQVYVIYHDFSKDNGDCSCCNKNDLKVVGCTYVTSCTSLIKVSKEFKLFKQVMLHELGHSVNLDHEKDPQSIMYYSTHNSKQKISENSINHVQQVMHCYD